MLRVKLGNTWSSNIYEFLCQDLLTPHWEDLRTPNWEDLLTPHWKNLLTPPRATALRENGTAPRGSRTSWQCTHWVSIDMGTLHDSAPTGWVLTWEHFMALHLLGEHWHGNTSWQCTHWVSIDMWRHFMGVHILQWSLGCVPSVYAKKCIDIIIRKLKLECTLLQAKPGMLLSPEVLFTLIDKYIFSVIIYINFST